MQPIYLRCFFAWKISPTNLKKIDSLITELKTQSPDVVKWSNSSQIHLTLKFIGQFNPVDIETIKVRLQDLLYQTRPFSLSIEKLGAFPRFNNPRVIWLGIETNPTLFDVVRTINLETEKLGYPSEKRPFSAHITLGRVKDYSKREDLKLLESILRTMQNIRIGSENVSDLYFIKSQLTPSGPVYEDLFNLSLQG